MCRIYGALSTVARCNVCIHSNHICGIPDEPDMDVMFSVSSLANEFGWRFLTTNRIAWKNPLNLFYVKVAST